MQTIRKKYEKHNYLMTVKGGSKVGIFNSTNEAMKYVEIIFRRTSAESIVITKIT